MKKFTETDPGRGGPNRQSGLGRINALGFRPLFPIDGNRFLDNPRPLVKPNSNPSVAFTLHPVPRQKWVFARCAYRGPADSRSAIPGKNSTRNLACQFFDATVEIEAKMKTARQRQAGSAFARGLRATVYPNCAADGIFYQMLKTPSHFQSKRTDNHLL